LNRKIGCKNILDARYFSVNRLASKCIQRHGLTRLAGCQAMLGPRFFPFWRMLKSFDSVFEMGEMAKTFAHWRIF
jgi:hypothetical protein